MGVTGIPSPSQSATKRTARPPNNTDDSTQSYAIGDLWGERDGSLYMASSSTPGVATWAPTDLSNVPLPNDNLPGDRVTGASAIYAAFKARSAYAGNCFQVKRLSDGTTLDIGFVYDSVRRIFVADWRAMDAFIAGTQAWYSIWYDQSGNGYDATATAFIVSINSSTSNTINDINGLRTLSFWGGPVIQMALPVGLSVSRQACSIISAGLVASSGHANAFCELGNDASYLNRLLLSTISRQGILQPIGNTNLVGPRVESGPCVVGASFGTTAANYMANDAVATSGALSAQTLTGGFIGSGNVGSYTYWGDYACLMIYPTAISAANMQVLRQSLSRILRIQPQARDRLIVTGDSITAAADAAVQPWWRQTLRQLNRDFKVFNIAVEGDTAASAVTTVAATFPAIFATGQTNIVCVGYGTNDLAAMSASNGDTVNATTTYNAIVAYCNAIRAAAPTGKIVVATILPRNNSFTGGQTSTSFEASRLIINTNIRANWPTFADALADYGGDPYIGQYSNVTDTTWMNGNLHPKERGQAYMGAYELAAINGLG